MANTTKNLSVVIKGDGQVVFLDHDGLGGMRSLGDCARRRASHVEPVRWSLRLAFRLIRSVVSDESRVAGWTRKWRCLWGVDLSLSGGPALGPFVTREAAIAAEESWLAERL